MHEPKDATKRSLAVLDPHGGPTLCQLPIIIQRIPTTVKSLTNENLNVFASAVPQKYDRVILSKQLNIKTLVPDLGRTVEN